VKLREKGSICVFGFALLAGCGGGGSSSGGTDSTEVPSEEQNPIEEVQLTSGGTPSSPAQMDFDGINEINMDEFQNHFVVDATEGDEIIITATLEAPISDVRITRCSSSPNSYYTGIAIDGDGVSCTRHLRHEFTETGSFVFKFGYPDNNSGAFQARLLRARSEPALAGTAGLGGTPDRLGSIDLEEENLISGISFFNHYGYRGKKGETIYLQAYVDPAVPEQTLTRCVSGASFNNRDAFGWIVLDGEPNSDGAFFQSFSCSDYFEYTFPEDGLYRFNYRSTVGGEGFFRATTTASPL